MGNIIARDGMCATPVIHANCSCGVRVLTLGHNERIGDVLHRIGIPCYNIKEHHAIPDSTEKD